MKKLVEEHGGEVEIESELDEGTCVTLVLPIGKTKFHNMLLRVKHHVIVRFTCGTSF